MHRPGHFRPFTDFLNQGMQKTNNVARSSNLNPNQPGYVQPPTPTPGPNPVPAPTQPSFNFPDFNQPVFNDPSSVVPDFNFFPNPVFQPVNFNEPIFNNPENVIPNFDLFPTPQTTVENLIQAGTTVEDFDNMATNLNFDFNNSGDLSVEDLTTYINLATQSGGNMNRDVINYLQDILFQTEVPSNFGAAQAPEFTGGGGMGGQLARQLYYPSTTGGFASAGSGITGGQSNLQNLLSQLGG